MGRPRIGCKAKEKKIVPSVRKLSLLILPGRKVICNEKF